MELPLPQVPSSLTDYVQRADYIMLHFWDALEEDDALSNHSSEFMEQNLVNFMSLFPHGSDDGCSQGIARLLDIISRDQLMLRTVTDIVELYLGDPASPMHDESHFILYLERLLSLPDLPEDMRERQGYLLTMAEKNRPGEVAADFAYIDRHGRNCTLHGTPSGERLLLIFYDPECERCKEVLQQLKVSDAASKMTVLAIYTEGNSRLWDESKASMPAEWIVGKDTSEIADREIYALPELPVMYLLDSEKRVLLKEATLNQLSLPDSLSPR